jgi:hypothetical protein
MTATSRLLVRTIALALLLLVPELLACEKQDNRRVNVSVVVILASETDAKVDKKLASIAREVRKIDPKLKGFQMKQLSAKSLKVGAADKFMLIDGQQASITVQKAADKMDRVRLKVAPPMMGEITYSTPCGKFLPIITPFRTKNNDLLIIAIRVQPCQGK